MTTNNKYSIYVIGDPIIDTYLFAEFSGYTCYKIDRTEHRSGGAANVYENICALIDNDIRVIPGYDITEPMKLWPRIWRFTNGIRTIFEAKKPREMQPVDPNLFYFTTGRAGLVIAEYNKGVCNSPLSKEHLSNLARMPKFEFVVVDSRYGTFCKDYLQFARMSILHVTGGELLQHDLSQFRYTFHTNGADSVALFRGKQFLSWLDVPPTKVTDTIGAGDTFTASIAAYLANHANQAWDDTLIWNAGLWAIQNCQQVIQVLGTAIPTREN